MTKRIISLMMVMAVAMSFATMGVGATNDTKAEEKVTKIVEKANTKIDKTVEKAKEKANDKNDEKVIEKLVEKTDKVAEQAVDQTAKNGAVIECEYVTVIINGQEVLVDPLRVISFGG